MPSTSSIENRRCVLTLQTPSDDYDSRYRCPYTWIDIDDRHGARTVDHGAVHSDHLAACGLHQFLECVTTIGVWFFGHGLHGLGGVIGRDEVQHCKPSLL